MLETLTWRLANSPHRTDVRRGRARSAGCDTGVAGRGRFRSSASATAGGDRRGPNLNRAPVPDLAPRARDCDSLSDPRSRRTEAIGRWQTAAWSWVRWVNNALAGGRGTVSTVRSLDKPLPLGNLGYTQV